MNQSFLSLVLVYEYTIIPTRGILVVVVVVTAPSHLVLPTCDQLLYSFFLFLFFSLFLSCLIALSLSEQYHCLYILHKVFCLSPHIFLLCEWYSTITDNKGNTF